MAIIYMTTDTFQVHMSLTWFFKPQDLIWISLSQNNFDSHINFEFWGFELQSCATIGPPAKRHSNGVSLVGP